MTRLVRAVCLTGFVLAVTLAQAADGPIGWRGDGTGTFTDVRPPSEWSSSKNVLWKVAMPGPSFSAPVAHGEVLYIASDPAELLCVRQSDGKILWRKSNNDITPPRAIPGMGKGGFGKGGGGKGGGGGGMGRSAGNTAATPVCDGQHIAVVFGNGVVAVYDKQGKRLWGKAIEASRVGFGHSASPLLLGDKVIVHFSDMVALDVKSGKELWRTKLQASHASPVAARLGKDDFIVSPAGSIVRAQDGQIVARGDFRTTDNSPVVVGDTIFVVGSGAFRLSQDKDGKVTVPALWSAEGGRGGGGGARRERKLPSPIVHDGLMYAVNTEGMLDVTDAKTGASVYRQRLPLTQVYSSVTLAAGFLYVFDTRGKAVVFKPGRTFERLAINDLEATGSCPTFVADRLFVRGQRNLYCISSKPKN